MSWNRDRILITVSALIFVFFGAWLFAVPTALEAIGIQLTTPEAFIDIRATYGGLELGLAAFLLVAQARPAWHSAAMLLSALCVGGFGLGRLSGIVIEGQGTPLMWFFLGLEVFWTGVMLWAYRKSGSE